MDKLDTYVNVQQLAKSLGLTKGSVYGLVRQGVLPAGVKLGRSRRWAVREVNAWLNGQKGVIV